MEVFNLKKCVLCGGRFEDWFIKDTPQKSCKRCDKLTNDTNRSFSQSKELLNMLGGDINKLVEVEGIIKGNSVFYFPSNLEQLNNIIDDSIK